MHGNVDNFFAPTDRVRDRRVYLPSKRPVEHLQNRLTPIRRQPPGDAREHSGVMLRTVEVHNQPGDGGMEEGRVQGDGHPASKAEGTGVPPPVGGKHGAERHERPDQLAGDGVSPVLASENE